MAPGEGFLNPDEVIESLDIRPGERVADFGCGAGFFSVPLAKKVGSSGKVYSFDIRPEALETTRAKSKLYHLFNIDASRADLELPNGSGLKNESVDKVFISNILFQVKDKSALVRETARILKQGGKIAIIEWSDLAPGAGGPSLEERIGEDEARKIFESERFAFERTFKAGSHHYGIIMKKT